MRKIVFLIVGFSVFLVSVTQVFALNEWSNKVKFKKTLELEELNRELEVGVSQEQVYDLKKDEWSAYKYAFAVGIDLIEQLAFSAEYTYSDNKGKKDEEELGVAVSYSYDLPWDIAMGYENKCVNKIRTGDQFYESKIGFSRQMFMLPGEKPVSLILGDKIAYDFQEDKWSENEASAGIEVGISSSCKLEITYSYIDALIEGSKNSSKVATQLTYSF